MGLSDTYTFRIIYKVGFPDEVRATGYRKHGQYLVFELDGREAFRCLRSNVAGVVRL